MTIPLLSVLSKERERRREERERERRTDYLQSKTGLWKEREPCHSASTVRNSATFCFSVSAKQCRHFFPEKKVLAKIVGGFLSIVRRGHNSGENICGGKYCWEKREKSFFSALQWSIDREVRTRCTYSRTASCLFPIREFLMKEALYRTVACLYNFYLFLLSSFIHFCYTGTLKVNFSEQKKPHQSICVLCSWTYGTCHLWNI